MAITQSRAKLDEFAAKFATDPTSALEWMGDSAHEHSARLQVLEWIAVRLRADGAAGLYGIREFLEREVMNGARRPKRSTSVCGNLSHQCRISAMAELLRELPEELPEEWDDGEKDEGN